MLTLAMNPIIRAVVCASNGISLCILAAQTRPGVFLSFLIRHIPACFPNKLYDLGNAYESGRWNLSIYLSHEYTQLPWYTNHLVLLISAIMLLTYLLLSCLNRLSDFESFVVIPSVGLALAAASSFHDQLIFGVFGAALLFVIAASVFYLNRRVGLVARRADMHVDFGFASNLRLQRSIAAFFFISVVFTAQNGVIAGSLWNEIRPILTPINPKLSETLDSLFASAIDVASRVTDQVSGTSNYIWLVSVLCLGYFSAALLSRRQIMISNIALPLFVALILTLVHKTRSLTFGMLLISVLGMAHLAFWLTKRSSLDQVEGFLSVEPS